MNNEFSQSLDEIILNQTAFDRKFIETAFSLSLAERGNYELPTENKYVLSEFVNGVYEFAKSKQDHKKSKQDHKKNCCKNLKYTPNNSNRNFYDLIVPIIGFVRRNNSLSKNLLDSFYRLTIPQITHSPPERPYQETHFDHFWKGDFGVGIASGYLNKTFSFPKEIVKKVDSYFDDSFSPDEKAQLEKISKFMSPFIEKDLERLNVTLL